MNELHYQSLSDVCRRIKSGELTSRAVTEHMLARIEALEPSLGAYVTVTGKDALATAERLDAERQEGKPLGPLHGVPIALKDLLYTRGVRTTCGTRVLADWVPDEDATVVTRLKEAGAVILGKLKLTEGAYSSHHPDVAAPRNPWNPAHWSGVSSSGSGVSVAAGLAFGAIGSDTGGSIRFPSAANGIVGIKPTFGRVSKYGAFPLAESLDHLGPMTRTVEDAARMLHVLAGHDLRDPNSLTDPVPNYTGALADQVTGVKIGVDWGYVETGVATDVVAAVRSAVDTFTGLGAIVSEVKLPDHVPLVDGWPITCGAECALAHADYFPERKEDYGPELAALLDMGRSADAMAYARMERARERFRADLNVVLDDVDMLIAPCMLSAAPTLEAMASTFADAEQTVAFINFTAPFDYSGHPTITLPAGLNDAGLPLAFQLIGRHLGESALVRAGYAFEQAGTPIHPEL
jgi:amidase